MKKQKKIPPGSVKLQFAGELVLARRPDPSYAGLFQRFDQLFELFANMERSERLLNYKLLNALMLSAHAKKTTAKEQKKHLFDLKNKVFINIASNKELRRDLEFRYLMSKFPLVKKYCDDCTRKNTEAKIDKHDWKFCEKCTLDKDFFNILSMQHNFKGGFFRVFLSNEHIKDISDFKMPSRMGKVKDLDEEGVFRRFNYNVRNLDAFDLTSVIEMNTRLLKS